MASCNSWQYLVTILAKIFPRSWQDLAKILLRYPWRVDPGCLNIETALSEIEDGATKKLIEFLLQQNAAKTKEIIELRNEVCSLEQRITLKERYSSKDSLIFENLPWDGKQSLPDFITSFLGEYLNFQTNPGNFKACHVLGRGQLNYPPAVIFKFIYFHEKNEIYGRKKC